MSLKKLVYNGFQRPKFRKVDCSDDPGRTDASQAEECDVNRILANYTKTGVWPASKVAGQFLDVSEAPDYHVAMNTIVEANDLFSRLDASIRKEFNNDPAQLMEALHDPAQREMCEKLGLLIPRQQSPSSSAIGDAPASNAASSAGGGASESASPKGKKLKETE